MQHVRLPPEVYTPTRRIGGGRDEMVPDVGKDGDSRRPTKMARRGKGFLLDGPVREQARDRAGEMSELWRRTGSSPNTAAVRSLVGCWSRVGPSFSYCQRPAPGRESWSWCGGVETRGKPPFRGSAVASDLSAAAALCGCLSQFAELSRFPGLPLGIAAARATLASRRPDSANQNQR